MGSLGPMSETPASDVRATDVQVTDVRATDVQANGPVIDLGRIERDLADVESALQRLDAGDYWRDEVTGAELPDELLEMHPIARRVGRR